MAGTLPSLPVIVGTGLTGCSISRSLARAGVRHLLVGPAAVGEGARLGESLNLEGSLDIVDYFPELSDGYLAKTAVIAHVGDKRVRCELNMKRGAASAAFYRVLGYREPPDAFLHVDRKGFDAAVFASVVADPHCRHVDALVEEVDYDAEGDRIRCLRLSDGREVVPIAVFDATNHVRAVARHLGLELELLGPAQRSVYGHYDFGGEYSCDDSLWHATHVVRLGRAADGVDGLAWYIPLKGVASIGVGVDRIEGAEEEELDDAELMRRVVAAIERRGIIPEGAFVPPPELRTIPYYRHFLHSRAYGRNWMLAGGTFCLMWFAASAGISSGFSAANVAPHFLREPELFGRSYERLLRGLQAPHGVFEWLRRSDPVGTDVTELERRADVLVAQSVLRLAEGVAMLPGRGRRAVAGAIAGAIRGEHFDASGICVRARELPSESSVDGRLAILREILDVFAGERPLAAIDACIAEDVVVHIDRLSFRGVQGWKKWAMHSRSTWPFDAIRFEIVDHSYEANEDQLTVHVEAVVRDRGADGERRSSAERFVYRFGGGQVREIWTSRRNYGFLYGPSFTTLPGFVAHVGRVLLWNLRRPELADDGATAAE